MKTYSVKNGYIYCDACKKRIYRGEKYHIINIALKEKERVCINCFDGTDDKQTLEPTISSD